MAGGGSVGAVVKRRLKVAVPLIFLFGVVPPFFLVWITWRLCTALLPARFFRFGDDCFYSTYQRCVNFFVERWTGSKIVLHGDTASILRRKERVIYISNHQSTLDWIVSNLLAERQGSMGHVRFVMKDSLQFIPLYGYYFYEHGCVYVKRGNFSQEKMLAALRYIRDMPTPTWLTIYPEGTRFRPDNKSLIDKSNTFARELGEEPFKHLLTPRVRGLQIALEHLRDRLDAVYDVTVAYSNTRDPQTGHRKEAAPSMFQFLGGVCPEVHVHVRRIDIKDVPASNEELVRWLFQVFREKDRLLDAFYSTEKDWTTEADHSTAVVHSKLLPTVGALAFVTTLSLPFVLTASGQGLFWKTIMFGTLGCYAWLAIKSAA